MRRRPVIDPRMAAHIAPVISGSAVDGDDGTLPDRATITRSEHISNGRGGWTTGTPEIIASGIPYRRESMSGQETVEGSQIRSVVEWTLTFPLGTDIRATDTVTDDSDGSVYQVKAPLDPQSYSPEVAVTATRTV